MSKIYKVFSKKFCLKTFNELKDNDNYYFFEIELVRFHTERWGYRAKAINTYLLEYVSKDINKPYTEQRYNSTRTIFGTSRFAILLYIYFNYMRNKKNKLW